MRDRGASRVPDEHGLADKPAIPHLVEDEVGDFLP
jgi:hypothetical protein